MSPVYSPGPRRRPRSSIYELHGGRRLTTQSTLINQLKLVGATGFEPAICLAATGLKVQDLEPFDNTPKTGWY